MHSHPQPHFSPSQAPRGRRTQSCGCVSTTEPTPASNPAAPLYVDDLRGRKGERGTPTSAAAFYYVFKFSKASEMWTVVC